MLKEKELVDLFTRYEYEQLELEENKFAIFSSTSSMYPAVEIVKLSNSTEEIEVKKKEYSEAGYAVRICEETDIINIEKYLFNWFFRVNESNKRLRIKYDEYTSEIMEGFIRRNDKCQKEDYEYINIPFVVEDSKGYLHSENGGLIGSIKESLREQGPELIILEAGAGFGKTSTVYEILKDYITVEKDIRPFFMELFKDRIAPTFHYLLNSQIDRDFKIRLKSDIVIYNIKRGYIPLIIDGFDELLSKDLDTGLLETNFQRVETMLSTISDLLWDNAKVILTTRRTAIFAGESFYEWYENLALNGHEFKIKRYQLGTPSVDDWLPESRITQLPSNFDKISNPVILGYLKYIDDVGFSAAIHSNSLVTTYLDSIYVREIERQDLPFTSQEQRIILQRLAAYFAGFGASSFSRSDVKATIEEVGKSILEDHSTSKKDVKNLSNTLTNHAFLDRKGDCNIGFLNDFIWGVFLMYAITYETEPLYDDFLKEATYSTIEKAILSASVFDSEVRKDFREKLSKRCNMNPVLSFWGDVLLLDKTNDSFSEVSLDGKNLHKVELGSDSSRITDCCFSNMDFTQCVFDFNYIQDCAFVNCKFNDCTKIGITTRNGFFGCKDPDKFIDDDVLITSDIQHEITDKEYIVKLLRMYFQVDERTQRMRMISFIKKDFDKHVFKRIFTKAISENYIITNGDKSFITPLGRNFFNANK